MPEGAARLHSYSKGGIACSIWTMKHFLAVARNGSTLAASRALGVDQSTVQRRLTELERRLGQALVKRHPTGYRLTEFGQAMLPTPNASRARWPRSSMPSSRPERPDGRRACDLPEPIVNRLTQSSLLERFHAKYPGLRVEYVISDRYVDLLNGEADVALRSGDTDDGDLIGRKIGNSYWAVCGSTRYLQQHGDRRAWKI